MKNDYQLLDCGFGRKLERFGEVILDRPCAQAVFSFKDEALWETSHARLLREGKDSEWETYRPIPQQWSIILGGVKCVLRLTDFGHVGVFPEHANFWPWMTKRAKGLNVLNLFAYSGGASLALALGGAKVCHVDASKGMVDWAKDNAAANGVDSVRWIVDDAVKFLIREEKRGVKYDAIILDPPSFGRGPQGEVFKLEEKIHGLLQSCSAVLSEKPSFVLLSAHTPGWTPKVLHELFMEYFAKSKVDSGEMIIGERLPSGAYARGVFS